MPDATPRLSPLRLPVLSFLEARTVLHSIERGLQLVETSLDLGRQTIRLTIRDGDLVLPDEHRLDVVALRRIADDTSVCYLISDGELKRIQRFDDETGRYYKLVPTGAAPTIEISGIRMHRTKDVTPWQDTIDKLNAIRPMIGDVLDTTTGLGYTASLAATTALAVSTIERDPNVLEIARANPWSESLFTAPNLRQIVGDSAELVPALPSAQFDRIVHDPPTLALAGDLYGHAFYAELLRVLRPGGRLFHYTGAPGSRHRGRDLPSSVAQRLRAAGFVDVRLRPEALGVVASRRGR